MTTLSRTRLATGGVDAAIAIAGAFQGGGDFGGGARDTAGAVHAFVAALGPDGSYRWDRTFGGSESYAWSLAIDDLGNVAVAGATWGTTDFGGGPRELGPASYAASYDDVGSHRWDYGRVWDGGDESVAVDQDGQVTAAFTRTLVRFDASGGEVWARALEGDAEFAGLRQMVLDAAGNIYVAGTFVRGTLDLGDGALTTDGPAAFVASYAPDSRFRFAHVVDGVTGTPDLGAIAVDASGTKVVVGGAFRGTVDFGGGPRTASAEEDLVVLSLSCECR